MLRPDWLTNQDAWDEIMCQQKDDFWLGNNDDVPKTDVCTENAALEEDNKSIDGGSEELHRPNSTHFHFFLI